MDYQGIESLVERYRTILDLIDEKDLMWHYCARNLKKADPDSDQTEYHACLASMQAPLRLASAIGEYIAFSEYDGYKVFRVSLNERYSDMILKGTTKDGRACEFFQDRSLSVNDIVVFVDGQETARYSIPDYQKEFFEKDRSKVDLVLDALSWLRGRIPKKPNLYK